MRKKIENRLKITCDDVDLTTITDVEFYVRQFNFFETYTPTVISTNEMIVIIPFEDAKKMREGDVKLQFAFTDSDGNPRASDVVEMNVDTLLKEVGYDPASR